MKPTPLVLLIATVLLSSHIHPNVCRPLSIFDGHGYKSQLDEVLLEAGDSAVSYLIGEKILQYLQKNPGLQRGFSRVHADRIATPLATERLAHLTRSLTPRVDSHSSEENSLEDLLELSKRNDDPPISIDLTFHLLRNMIEMARNENQREQAELNRKYLDEVGKWWRLINWHRDENEVFQINAL